MKNPFKTILNYFKKSYWTSFGSVFFKDEPGQPTNVDYFDAYEVCFLVHSCVRKICEKIANTELKLYKIKSKVVDEIEDHELLDLIAKPNPFMTKFDLLDSIQMYLELSGNAYILQIRGENTKKTRELWMLRPDWVKILPGNVENPIGGYEYRIFGGEVQTYKSEDIIHIKQPNPRSFYYGLSTVKPALEIIRNLVYATRWNMNFFYRNARPDFILTTTARMDKEEKDEFAKQWEQKFGGLEKSHRFAIFSGEEVDIKEITKTAREMEFSKLTDAMIQQILSAFGVPKPIVGMTTDLNRATAEAAIYTFLSETIEPKVKRIIDKLNGSLVMEYGEDIYLDFIDPTPENREFLLKEYDNALKNNWMVINEVRDLEGLPPLEGGWDFYLPLTLMPAGGLKEGQESYAKIKGIGQKDYERHKEEKRQKILRKKILQGKRHFKAKEKFKSEAKNLLLQSMLIPFKKMQEIKKWDKAKKDLLWKEHDKLLTGDEKLFKILTIKLFKSQAKRILEALRDRFGKEVKKGKFDLIDWGKEEILFAEISFSVFEDIVKRRGKRMADLIGSTFEMTEGVRKFIDKKSIIFAEQVNDTTKNKLRETLKEGVGAGEGIDDLTKRVNELFDSREKWEAERIARTEVLGASNGADVEAYRQSEVIEKKEWLTAPGACDICGPLNGEIADVDKDFSTGDNVPPAHPNCRCTTLPVIEEVKAIESKKTKIKQIEKQEEEIEEKPKETLEEIEKRISEKIEKNVEEKIMEKIGDVLKEYGE